MGDARCLFGFLTTLAVCYVSSSSSVAGSEVRVGRSTPWRVSTIMDFPYSRKKTTTATKNEDYEGYVPDVLKKIGQHLHQSYTIHEVEDPKYGAKDPATGKWTGMIGELVDQKAEIAAGAITISDARKDVVDFTEPLMSIQVVILLKKPSDGSETPIKSAEDLAGQTDIKFGVVKDGTTFQLIHNSTLPHFQKIWTALNADPNRLVSTSEDGVGRVRSGGGKFAFITESATGNYWANLEPCDLIQIATSLPKTEHAFAVVKGSAIKARLDGAIKQLKENGELEKIREKWWEHKCSSGALLSWGAPIVLPLFVLVLATATSPRLN